MPKKKMSPKKLDPLQQCGQADDFLLGQAKKAVEIFDRYIAERIETDKVIIRLLEAMSLKMEIDR